VLVKSSRKQAKAGENAKAFICFLLFFGIETFQRVMIDSNDFFSAASSSLAHPSASAIVPPIAWSALPLVSRYASFLLLARKCSDLMVFPSVAIGSIALAAARRVGGVKPGHDASPPPTQSARNAARASPFGRKGDAPIGPWRFQVRAECSKLAQGDDAGTNSPAAHVQG
jgi:hypothetical protein